MTDTTLPEAIVTTFQSLLSEVHTCLPGRIEKYEYKPQKAEVKPLIKRKYLDGEVLTLRPLANVPVVFPRTRKSGLTFPLVKGDGVLIIFSERAMERYLSSGQDSEPGDRRKFDLSDGIAIPGLFSFADQNLASNNEDMELHHEGQKVTIKKNGDIQMGTESLKKLVNENVKSVYEGHTHNFWDVFSSLAYTTSTPAQSTGTVVKIPPIGVVPANGFESEITSSELTSKVKAQ